jgi:hypothetical protein
MGRLLLSLAVLLCLSPAALAAEDPGAPLVCKPPAEWQAPPAFEPVTARPLTGQEQRDLQRLFRSLEGDWQGGLQEHICMHSGGSKQRDYQLELEIDAVGDELRMRGDYVQPELRTRRRLIKRLFVTPDGLRVDVSSRAGEVELMQADSNTLAYRLRFRHVLRRDLNTGPGRMPSTGQGAVVPGAIAGASNLTTQGEGEGADGDADTAAPTDGGSPPAGGDDTATDAQAPSKIASVAREERFTLRRLGQRSIEVSQQFFTQGVYTGSMTWQLRRR